MVKFESGCGSSGKRNPQALCDCRLPATLSGFAHARGVRAWPVVHTCAQPTHRPAALPLPPFPARCACCGTTARLCSPAARCPCSAASRTGCQRTRCGERSGAGKRGGRDGRNGVQGGGKKSALHRAYMYNDDGMPLQTPSRATAPLLNAFPSLLLLAHRCTRWSWMACWRCWLATANTGGSSRRLRLAWQHLIPLVLSCGPLLWLTRPDLHLTDLILCTHLRAHTFSIACTSLASSLSCPLLQLPL